MSHDRMPSTLYIGLMSGTSLDGVDAVLVDLAPNAGWKVMAHRHAPYPPVLRDELLALNAPGQNELHRAALAGNGVARAYASIVTQLLAAAGIAAHAVRAIGAHGQTVRHRPQQFDGVGYTSQLLNAPLLAELTGIDVIADFRSRDVAAGGQGAPLVPAFHHAVFGRPDRTLAVLNVGGIANITLLPAAGPVSGHDCGPGNVLIDLWCQQHSGHPFDADGAWGRSGRLLPELLADCLADAFVQASPPKSTGRDHFHAEWLAARLLRHPGAQPADVQCTLTHFTASAAALALKRHLPTSSDILVCGGGALNAFLMDCLREQLSTLTVRSVNTACALDPMHIEAAAFAWLAKRFISQEPGNLPAVTGSSGPRILGALYPA
jgi:anhydro-N-acetylmuramic acid kinase